MRARSKAYRPVRNRAATRLRRGPAAVCAWALVMLGACTQAVAPPPAVTWPARPHAELVELSHRVAFATDRAEPDAGERDRLVAFLAGLPSRPVGRIRVVGHADERASDPYNLDLAARRARAVAEIVREVLGAEIPVDRRSLGEFRPLDPGHGPAAWRRNRRAAVEVVAAVVRVDDCEPLTTPSGYRLDNGPYAGLGCATARNLAAMLADPADLASPRKAAAAPAGAAAAAVGRYREGKITPLLENGDGK